MWKYLILSYLCLNLINGEIYSSVDQMTRWSQVEILISKLVNEAIKLEEDKLSRLKHVKESLIESVKEEKQSESNKDESLFNPVKAFIKINKLSNAIEKFVLSLEMDRFDSDDMQRKLIHLDKQYNLPDEDDLSGAGEAILRLQSFYDLNVDDIIRGKLLKMNDKLKSNNGSEIDNSGTLMSYFDCFEIGKIAYENQQYYNSIEWLGKTLELIEHDVNNPNNSKLVIDILDYMSFAAFKIGEIKYSARLTKAWLERDPDNQRAIENLAYYEEKLEQGETFDSYEVDEDHSYNFNKVRGKNYSEIYKSSRNFNPRYYEITEDDTVRYLCKSSSQLEPSSRDFCYHRSFSVSGFLYPGVKIEQLHSSPDIFRVYDILTNEEASYLRKLAKTRLLRSTVQSRYGSLTTDYRIAKTAWLSTKLDPIIEKIEKRLSDIFHLNMTSSEDLQVVNYGLAGYYGPHLDSSRETSASDKKRSSVAISKLADNDRLATILIYLNHVEAGGATVFPRLNLTVKPIERSAVFWYNLKTNGYTDYKTLHSGCPVLMGSKWIATKWPRENGNNFRSDIRF